MYVRCFNFRTKFKPEKSYKIFLAIDKFGNIVEEKNEKFTPNTRTNISNDIWEPDTDSEKK